MAYRYRVLDKSHIIDKNEVKDEEIENKYIEITDYIGSERDFDELIIPEKIDGYEVVGICREAFRSMATLEINKLIIPDSVSFIADTPHG